MLAVDVAASSTITTLRTSFIPMAFPTTAAWSERRAVSAAVASAADKAGMSPRFDPVRLFFVYASGVLFLQELV
jgi:hypothetical protein